MLRRLLSLLLLAFAFVAPPAARAESGPHVPAGAMRVHLAQAPATTADPATDPQIAQWLGLARAYWNASPNCPQGISLVRAESLPDPGVWAAAVPGGCEIAFDPDFYPAPAGYDRAWWQAAMCSVVAHEYGHLLGYGHVADPSNLMNPVTPINIVPGCPTWGLPSATPAPAQAATPAPEPQQRKAAKSSRKTCAARARGASRQTKAARACKAPAKRRSHSHH